MVFHLCQQLHFEKQAVYGRITNVTLQYKAHMIHGILTSLQHYYKIITVLLQYLTTLLRHYYNIITTLLRYCYLVEAYRQNTCFYNYCYWHYAYQVILESLCKQLQVHCNQLESIPKKTQHVAHTARHNKIKIHHEKHYTFK